MAAVLVKRSIEQYYAVLHTVYMAVKYASSKAKVKQTKCFQQYLFDLGTAGFKRVLN